MLPVLADGLHWLVIICVCSTPFWPAQYLAYALFIPLVIKSSHVVFGGCPLTILGGHQAQDKYFSQVHFLPRCTKHEIDQIEAAVLIGITAVIGYRAAR